MCTNCDRATAEPWHQFSAGCIGCCARSVARSPQFHRVRSTGMQDRHYRALLAQLGVTHQQVKDASASDACAKERA